MFNSPGMPRAIMAKEYAKAFYRSKQWRDLRKQILRRDLYTCEDCGGRATEVHHEIELTPQNISDPAISLNPKLLHSLCHDCHTKHTKQSEAAPDGYMFDSDGHVVPISAR